MKLYTRTGDDGTTGLFGGGRVLKNNPRVEAYGAVDELNAALGLALSNIEGKSAEAGAALLWASFRSILSDLQSRLFDLGADLATPHGSRHEAKVARINQEHATQAEHWIDEVESGNDPMRNFVLPGGTELAARLHVARTICRRAERCLVTLSQSETINPQTVIFVNRVSDLLFAMARRANKNAGVADVPWTPDKPVQ